jgi:biopolymer transport protein ExbD
MEVSGIRSTASFWVFALLVCACSGDHTKAPAPVPAAPVAESRDAGSVAFELPMVDAGPILIIAVTKTDVLLDGASLGTRPDAPTLAVAIEHALAAKKRATGTVVLRAATTTSALTIDAIVRGLTAAGFKDVLFDTRTEPGP